MDTEAFKAALQRDGYAEITVKEMEPGLFVDEHSHPFDVRAMVLEGEAELSCHGETKTYRAGDIVEMAAGVIHTEKYATGTPYKFLLGRRTPAA